MIYGFDNGDMTIEAALIRAVDECDRLRAAEKRIRKLHHDLSGYCGHCSIAVPTGGLPGASWLLEYPCPTIKELDKVK